MDKFVLKRRLRRFKQGDNERPKIYVRPETYNILADWAMETGMSMADIAFAAVEFAAKHVEWDFDE